MKQHNAWHIDSTQQMIVIIIIIAIIVVSQLNGLIDMSLLAQKYS